MLSTSEGNHSLEAFRRPAPADRFSRRSPAFLDGALLGAAGRFEFVRRMKPPEESDPVPKETPLRPDVLRELLESLNPKRPRTVAAGLAPVAPRLMHVWWSLAGTGSPGDVIADVDRSKPVLRFYDVTGLDAASERWNQVFDIDVELAQGWKTVDFWSDDRTYLVDVGLRHADGRFTRLARTNVVSLPREGSGDGQYETTAVAIAPVAEKRLFSFDAGGWTVRGADFPERDAEAERFVHAAYREFLRGGPRFLVPLFGLRERSGAVLAAEYEKREAARRRGDGKNAARNGDGSRMVTRLEPVREAAAPKIEYPLQTARFRPVAGHVADSPCRDLLRFMRMPRLERFISGRDGLLLSAGKQPRAVSRLAGIPVRAAAAELRAPGADGRMVFPRAAEAGVSGAPEGEKPAGARIERMTMILEGRAKPGAVLKVGGKVVRAAPDGSFRVECVLSGRASRRRRKVHASAV